MVEEIFRNVNDVIGTSLEKWRFASFAILAIASSLYGFVRATSHYPEDLRCTTERPDDRLSHMRSEMVILCIIAVALFSFLYFLGRLIMLDET